MRLHLQPVHLRTLFSISSSARSCSLSIFISHFSTSQTQPLLAHPFPRRHEEQSRRVKVSVWWDFENCNPPADCNVFKIANTITAALRANGIMGPLEITAFGDILQLSRANLEALSSTGVNVSHVPNGGKNSADRTLLVDLMNWISQNPPPAHLLLISGDRDFASILHRLRMNNYNILLACQESKTPSVLCSAASIMWNWETLLKNEELTGKYYNQPPDGPYGSWYGHYKVSLEDPFLVEQPACSGTKESSKCSDSKPMPVPKAVTNQIRKVLNSCPKGISIVDLRSELTRLEVSLDKDFYGYKKFSSFLLSMPHILRLQFQRDGQFIIHGHYKVSLEDPFLVEQPACSGTKESSKCSDSKPMPVPKAVTNQIRKVLNSCPKGISIVDLRSELTRLEVSLDKDFYGYKKFSSFLLSMPHILRLQFQRDGQFIIHGITPKAVELSESNLGLSAGSVCRNGDKLIVSSRSSGVSLNGTSELQHSPDVNVVVTPRKVQQTPPENDNLVKVNAEEPPSDQVSEIHVDSEGSSAKRDNYTLKKCTGVSFEKEGMKEECEKRTCEAAYHPVTVSSSNAPTTDNKGSAEAGENHSGKSSGLFNRIASCCEFWKSRQESQSCEKHEQINTKSLKHEVFTQDSFWKDVENLMDSLEGSLLVTKSRTREEMAENMQKRGSLALRSLRNFDLLQLVHLLISDKKWIEEHPSQTFPFKISRAVEKSPDLGHSPLDVTLQPKSTAMKKLSNIPRSGVSSTIVNEKYSDCSRYEILVDCRELVKEILKEHPEGYNIPNFGKLFQERYGYPLDIRRLGYKKLASLLGRMPGVKIVETYIFPASTVPDNSGLDIPNIRENTSRALGKSACELPYESTSDDSDSTWDELGAACELPYRSLSDDKSSDSQRKEDLNFRAMTTTIG